MEAFNVIYSLTPEAVQAVADRGLSDLRWPTDDIMPIPSPGDCVVFDDAAGAPVYKVSGRMFAALPDGRRAVIVYLDYLTDLEVPLALPSDADDEEVHHG